MQKYGDITNKSGDLMEYDGIFDVILTSSTVRSVQFSY